MNKSLLSLGYFISNSGGSSDFLNIKKNEIFFECITAGEVYAPNSNVLCGPGWVFAHQAGEHTVWQSPVDKHYECMSVHFKIENTQKDDKWLRSVFVKDEKSLISFVHEMLYAFHHTEVNKTVLAELIWCRFRYWVEIFRKHENQHEIPPRVSRIINYIDKHFSDSIGINDLADYVDLSSSYLHAQFREYIGITPHQYLIGKRMKSARHELVTTRLPIKAIAIEVGYSNAAAFCKAFKQYFGSTAANYRRKYTIYSGCL